MKQVYYSNIGEVKYIKRKGAKYINISVQPSSCVRVSLPYFVSYQYAEKVLLEKMNWVRSKIEKVKLTEKKLTNFYFDTEFKTKYHNVILKPWSAKSIKGKTENGTVEIFIPKEKFIGDDSVQNQIRKIIIETYRVEAKKFFPARVKELAMKHGIEFSKVFVKNMKSQWGSCSRRKNINLNLHLMRLPDELIDYVILHELTHINEMNHSKKFWRLLESRVNNSKYLDKKIKDYSINFW